jgi:hypothetical protein
MLSSTCAFISRAVSPPVDWISRMGDDREVADMAEVGHGAGLMG